MCDHLEAYPIQYRTPVRQVQGVGSAVEEHADLHELDPERFRQTVQSFEFWFDSVRGYLEGLEYGRRPTTPDTALSEAERERLITVLCNYCVGERAALEGAGGLIQIAPNHAAKVFLATQTADEGRHLEILMHRLGELGVEHPEEEIDCRASASLLDFRRRLLELVRGRDWASAIFAQNVILESMEFAVFQAHLPEADPRTRELLEGIIKDERRHIGFGENELGRRIAEAPSTRNRLLDVRQEFDYLVLQSFQEILDSVGATRREHTDLGRNYLEAVERLGFA